MQHTWQKENHPLAWLDLRNVGKEPITAISTALQFQHRFFLSEMKGALLPPHCVLQGNEVILDLLCGPGNWCIDVSQRYPEAQVWGVDSNQRMVDLAVENAAHCSSGALHFRPGDYRHPLPFARETFDVIHLQNGTGFFPFHHWPALMADVVRVLKPGGWLHFVDFEIGAVSHPAVDRLLVLFGQLLASLNRSTALDGPWPLNGCTLGPHRMAQHAFTDMGYHLYPLDLGRWQNQAGQQYLIWCLARPEIILALAEQTGIDASREWQRLVRQAQWEVQMLSFCGVGMLLSAFGRKPVKPNTHDNPAPPCKKHDTLP